MSNEKLGSVAILAIEWERAQSLDSDKVIDAFAAVHNKKAQLLLTNPRDAYEMFARFTEEQWGCKLYS